MKKLLSSLMLLGVVVTACSSEDPAAANDADVVNVQVSSNVFTPASITIKVGQTVRWTWAGGSHNVVSGASCSANDNKFRSGSPQSGGTFEHKFETAGTFPYYCEPHCEMGMKGEVVVQ